MKLRWAWVFSVLIFTSAFSWVRVAQGQIPSTQDADLSPKTFVTLHVVLEPAADVAREIALQTGMAVTLAEVPEQGNTIQIGELPVSLDFDHMPFWDAMARFCAAIHAVPRYNQSDLGVMLEKCYPQSPPLGGRFSSFGAISSFVDRVEHRRTINLQTESMEREDWLDVTTLLDPQLRMVQCGPAKIQIATDELGHHFLPFEQDMTTTPEHTSECNWLGANAAGLLFPVDWGRQLKYVQGTIQIKLATHIDHLVIDDVQKATGKSVSLLGRTMKVVSVEDRRDNQGHLVTVSCARPNSDSVGFNIAEEIYWGMHVEDGDGKVIGHATGKYVLPLVYKGTTFDMDVYYSLPESRRAKLVWDVPTQTKDVTVPFEFTDLPLPAN